MSITNIVEEVKLIHPKYIALVKAGKFYSSYGKDAYILSYIFKYQLRKTERNIETAGFPEGSLKKIEAHLQENKINYLILDRRNNYEVDEKNDNGNLNQYDKTFEKAKKYVNNKKRLDHIYEYMIENINKSDSKKILDNMEEIINERRKV